MGPLAGIKILELAGIGPSPMCAMLLADLGATVLRVESPLERGMGIPRPRKFDLVLRGRPVVQIDLKAPLGLALAHELVGAADVLIEGFRPGTTEKLGLGPDKCLELNPTLVYGRVTGWGQDGPLARTAGHDLNYIAVTGVLDAIGEAGRAPAIPLNLIGDYAGGALYLAMGVLAAVIEARQSGRGQVVDAAMIDGVASLSTLFYGLAAGGIHHEQRGSNVLDGGAPFYNVYECADGKWVAIGAIEPKFYRQLLDLLEIDGAELGAQMDRDVWPQARERIAARFKTRPRAEWSALMESTDACFSSVMTFQDASEHPQLAARGTFVNIDGVRQPAPAPRFSRSRSDLPTQPTEASPEQGHAGLRQWLSADRVDALVRSGAIA